MRSQIVLLALFATFSFACGSSSPTTPSLSSSGNSVSIVAGASTMTTTAFAPNPITVSAGGTVTWTNADSTAHTSTSDSGAWDSGTIAPGGKFSMTFMSTGSFPYHCLIHPGMVGTVNVQ